MAETILHPLDTDDGDGDPLSGFNLQGFDENNPATLNDLLRDLTNTDQDKVGFDDLSVASPYGRFGSWLRARPFMSSELPADDTSKVEETRNEVASELRYRSGDPDVVDDARVVASELATNLAIHGGAEESDITIAGIFRARTIRGGIVFEAANGSASVTDSDVAKIRGTHESGNGFKIIQDLAADHGGTVGKYMVVDGLFGRERIVTDPAEIQRARGRWVVWATFQTPGRHSQTLAA
ncbi:MAG TPA: hypothetical protein VJ843_03085 [Candidatus Saccharimonadales bacterium]|nr:hypothetical protein [Candidatus Saccharimonadales bacterium]